MRVPLQLLDKAEAEFNPKPDDLRALRQRISSGTALELDPRERRERRKAMIAEVAAEGVLDANERYIGLNDLLPINYLLLGHLHAQAVGCIRYFDRVAGKPAVATGFLISESLLLTNHHVFPVSDAAGFGRFASDARVEFGHQYGIDGTVETPVVFDLDPGTFFHSHAPLDFAVVAVRPKDRTGSRTLRAQGYLVLNGRLGKAGLGDAATIVQHPNGQEKQIAIRKNEIINLDLPDFLVYLSDTAQGSSGAPVFNDQWQVIALHSAGVAKKDAQGRYVDRDGNVIEAENGAIDADRVVWIHNRGARVSRIMEHLAAPASGVREAAPVAALFTSAYTDSRPYAFLSRPSDAVEKGWAPAPAEPRTMAGAPASTAAPPAVPTVQIQISLGGGPPVLLAPPAGALDEAAFEKKYEDELDFGDCAGFDVDFLETPLPMPTPTRKLERLLARRLDNPSRYLLDYQHVSTIQHAVRRVPVVSAINVDGRSRYPSLTGRSDRWFRDNRLDQAVQLDDAWYKASGFDKGHLSRREDAEWGRTEAAARRAAELTCGYANAVPQVPALNRARFGSRGLWGLLEQKLLEEGVKGEAGRTARIDVLSGPIFQDDDPVFRGVQVALRFFKVVAWYDGAGRLRTTCFRLSQEALVDQIEFEVLRFDQVFRNEQVALGEIEEATGLKFAAAFHDAADPAGGTFDERAFERLVSAKRRT